MRWLRRLLAGWIAFRLLAPEWVPKYVAGQKSPLRLEGRSLFIGDREMFVREMGDHDAPPLVLIHGWGDHSLVVFSKLIPRLAERFRVYAIDNRNTGRSDMVRGEYEITTMADEVAGVIDQLGLGGVPVFGYSMGGMIAQALTQRHPHLVSHLILSGTAAAPPGAGHPLALLGRIGAAIARLTDRISRSEVSWIRTRYLLRVGAIEPEHALWFYTQHRNRDPDSYWAAFSAISRFDARDWAGRLTVPSLVIITCDDQLMPSVFQYRLASLLRDPHVVELPSARHEAPLTHVDEIVSAIGSFLDVSV